QELQELAPEAEIITGDYKKRSADWFRSLLEKRGGLVPAQEDHEPCQEHHHHDHDHHHGEEALTTVTLTRVAVPHPLYLMRFLDLVTKSCFGRIPRAKGYLPCGNEWVRFDLVQDRWLITGFAPQEEARVTLIGTRLKEEAARSWFEGAEGAARSGL
ncbi:GTP-binding protein, partial [Acidaminococcus fermentans]|uniref:GTP-binding protein n=1 Tax=Acidaminococcus fermentans TaxID=905 RepID=UPI0039F44CFD